MEYIIFLLSLVIVIKSSDIFLDNSIKISKILNIPEVIIGATIVSIGTTLPEIMVSATSAMIGHSDISYGNALGSIICNTALISGISLSYKSIKINVDELKLPTIFFVLASVIICIDAYLLHYFTRFSGIILALISLVYFYIVIKHSNNQDYDYQKDIVKDDKVFKIVFYLIVSAILLGISARMMTDNSIIIAKNLGIPESSIALSIVALGTSLPELMTCIQSLRKGHSSISLGNIIGANLINLLLVIGISSIISPYGLPNDMLIYGINDSLLVDIPLYLIVMFIMLVPIFLYKRTNRWQGVVLLLIYFTYIYYLYNYV